VAAKKHKKKSWAKRLAFYLCFPLLVWIAALLIWFYWNNIWDLFGRGREPLRGTPRAAQGEKSARTPANKSQEKILDEDRRRLEDILKRK
jgi:hypothetical protein